MTYDGWLAALSVDEIEGMFRRRGCSEILVKALAGRQDNDKNQIYVASDLGQLGKLASGNVVGSDTSSRKPGASQKAKFTASMKMSWLAPTGDSPAPEAKLIYYPQYPEVRLSGLIQGSPNPPRSLYVRSERGQESGRHLLIASNQESGHTFALLLPPEARAIPQLTPLLGAAYAAFRLWTLGEEPNSTGRAALLNGLRRIHRMGWVPGQRLSTKGIIPYTAQNGAGYTLEALLGVSPNGRSEPDFHGWELKSHSIASLSSSPRGPVTLLTPQPSGGLYTTDIQDFLRAVGHPTGIPPHRYDFTGIHRVGALPLPRSGTSLRLRGWDTDRGIRDDGAVQLLNATNDVVASWAYDTLMTHWKRKHAQACYVPYVRRSAPGGGYEYHFSKDLLLCTKATFLRLLTGFHAGQVYYDPGINMQRDSPGSQWRVKHRNQFRVGFQHLHDLYETHELVELD